jgi:hypothetical protein
MAPTPAEISEAAAAAQLERTRDINPNTTTFLTIFGSCKKLIRKFRFKGKFFDLADER